MASKAEPRKSYVNSIYSTLGTVTVFAVVGIALAIVKGYPERETDQGAKQGYTAQVQSVPSQALPAPSAPVSAPQSAYACSNPQTLG